MALNLRAFSANDKLCATNFRVKGTAHDDIIFVRQPLFSQCRGSHVGSPFRNLDDSSDRLVGKNHTYPEAGRPLGRPLRNANH